MSTLPTQFGERVLLRLLDSDAPLKDSGGLGIAPETIARLGRILSLPPGVLLVTGRPATGKSTTLRSCLAFVQQRSLNMVTRRAGAA